MQLKAGLRRDRKLTITAANSNVPGKISNFFSSKAVMEEYGDNGTSIGDKSQGYSLGRQFIPMMAATNATDFKVNINRKS